MSQEPNSHSPVLEALQKAAEGLLFPSEIDAPLVPFFWPEPVPPEAGRLIERAEMPEGTSVKRVSLAAFFRSAVKEEDWHNDEERAEVKKFQALIAVLKDTLKQPQVWLLGEVNRIVYIVGGVEGGSAGLQTRVVET